MFIAKALNDSTSTRRKIGWCSQHNSLFDYLNVLEHLEMYYALMGYSAIIELSAEISNPHATLMRLGMSPHIYKFPHELSEGMKRRVCLALAMEGNPSVLLLDEPTSGCDAYTRDLIRTDILRHKNRSAILVSTHHIDDVEILSDRVWFVNDHKLVYDGPLGELNSSCERPNDLNYNAQVTRSSSLEFVTMTEKVQNLFEAWFAQAHQWKFHHDLQAKRWLVPNDFDNFERLLLLVQCLEEQNISEWSISSPTIYDAVNRLYEKISEKVVNDNSSIYRDDLPETSHNDSFLHVLYSSHMFLLLGNRYDEMKSNKMQFIVSHIFFPFIVVFMVIFLCADVSYPSMELSSDSLGGIGHIKIGNIFSNTKMTSAKRSTTHDSPFVNYDKFQVLDKYYFNSIEPSPAINSDKMMKELYSEYFKHRYDRWASFIVNDKVPKWLEGSILLNQSSMRIPINIAKNTIDMALAIICNGTSDISYETSALNLSTVESIINTYYHVDFIQIGDCSELSFDVRYHSGLTNNSIADTWNLDLNGGYLAIQAFEDLISNLTFMSNVTADHASPVFLKEMIPVVYETVHSGDSNKIDTFLLNSTSFDYQSAYKLFSHPLVSYELVKYVSHSFVILQEDRNPSSPAFLQRGYLGGLMILLYILISSASALRSIVRHKRLGIKTQLHLCGVSVWSYWVSNFLADSIILLVSFTCIYIGIWIGGPPVRNFFFDSYSYPGVAFFASIVLFSSSIVSSNYALAVVSENETFSQLFAVISSISLGIFLKLFLCMQKTKIYLIVSNALILISPSFAFSTCILDMFAHYTFTLGKSVGILSSKFSSEKAILWPLCAMVCQTVYYLVITIYVDKIWYRFIAFCRKKIIYLHEKCSRALGQPSKLFTRCSNFSIKNSIRRMLNTASTPYEDITEERSIDLSKMGNRFCSSSNSGAPETASSENIANNNPFSHSLIRDPQPMIRSVGLSLECEHSSHRGVVNLEFEAKRGERIALIGSNGGGKTTLLKALTSEGSIPVIGNLAIFGNDTVKSRWEIWYNNDVGYVPQVS